MKKLVLMIVMVSLIVCNCAMIIDEQLDIPKFNDLEDAVDWVWNEVNYQKDSNNHWKTPIETLNDKYALYALKNY